MRIKLWNIDFDLFAHVARFLLINEPNNATPWSPEKKPVLASHVLVIMNLMPINGPVLLTDLICTANALVSWLSSM